MSCNQEDVRINFDLLQNLDPIVISDRPETKRELFYTSLIIKLYKSTGKAFQYPPRKRKLHRWSRKDS